MPGVVENDQARRISKAIDDDIKVSFLGYKPAPPYPPPTARKRTDQEKAETKKGRQGCVTSQCFPLFLYHLVPVPAVP